MQGDDRRKLLNYARAATKRWSLLKNLSLADCIILSVLAVLTGVVLVALFPFTFGWLF